MHDLFSARLRSLVESSGVPSQAVLADVDPLAPKCQYLVSDCGLFHHQYSTFDKRTQVFRPPCLMNLSPPYSTKHANSWLWMLFIALILISSSSFATYEPPFSSPSTEDITGSFSYPQETQLGPSEIRSDRLPHVWLGLWWICFPNRRPILLGYIALSGIRISQTLAIAAYPEHFCRILQLHRAQVPELILWCSP